MKLRHVSSRHVLEQTTLMDGWILANHCTESGFMTLVKIFVWMSSIICMVWVRLYETVRFEESNNQVVFFLHSTSGSTLRVMSWQLKHMSATTGGTQHHSVLWAWLWCLFSFRAFQCLVIVVILWSHTSTFTQRWVLCGWMVWSLTFWVNHR